MPQTQARQMKTWRMKVWPAYVVLALSGLPLFGWIVWKEINAGPVGGITFEVDANDVVTVKAAKRWVTVERPGFHWPRDEGSLLKSVRGFAREAEMDDYSCPLCPVRIAVEEGAHADTVCGLIIIVMRNFLWDLTLVSPGRTVKIDLPRDDGQRPIWRPGKPRDVLLGSLALPEGEGGDRPASGEWRLTKLAFKKVTVVDYAAARVPWTIRGRIVAVDLGGAYLSIEFGEPWRKLVDMADGKDTAVLDRPEDGDFSKLEAVYVHWATGARAADLVRAVEFLRHRHPSLKIILVEPASR